MSTRGKPTFRNDCELTSREVRMLRRILLNCVRCPPHRHENATRRRPKPDKHKNHRRATPPGGKEGK